MRNPILKSLLTLAAFLPVLTMPQPLAAQREGSWEFSGSGGVVILDRALLDLLASGSATSRFTNRSDPGRIAPAAVARLGYNFTNHLGFGLGSGWATGSGVTYLTPFAAVTYTPNLNATTSPFLTTGMQFTRISGNNGRLTHPTWGAHLGVGSAHLPGTPAMPLASACRRRHCAAGFPCCRGAGGLRPACEWRPDAH